MPPEGINKNPNTPDFKAPETGEEIDIGEGAHFETDNAKPDFSAGDLLIDPNGKSVQILDSNQRGQYLIQDKEGNLNIVPEVELAAVAVEQKITPEKPTTPEPEIIPEESEMMSIIEKTAEKEDVAEITKETQIEIEEPTVDNELLRPGQKLIAEFKARNKKINELLQRTELSRLEPLSYRQIDNLFHALAIMQLSLKRMVLPIDGQIKFCLDEATKLSDPKFADFSDAQDLKEDYQKTAEELTIAKDKISSLSTKIDNQKDWWAVQKSKEEQIIDKANTGEVDYNKINFDNLPDRIIIDLEAMLEQIQPPVKNPIESETFYLNPKRNAEEFFIKMIKDPIRFFNELQKKEREYSIALGRFRRDDHSESYTRAFLRFKNFVNKYVERFNNMLTLMGVERDDEKRIIYDYNPDYSGRAQNMKNLWTKITNEYPEKVNSYREKLGNKRSGDLTDEKQVPELENYANVN